jgi:Na+-driven multidrug efflux pump
MMMIMLMAVFRGAGDAVTPLRFMVLAVAIDIGLNPIFILGLGPAPRLGIVGSSTAAVIACYVTLLAMIAHLYWRGHPLRLEGPELSYLRPRRTWLQPILIKGFPMGLQMTSMAVSALALIGWINSYGVTTTAAYAVIHQLWNYVQMPAMALGMAVTAMAAQNIGDGKWSRVGHITLIGIIQSTLITGFLILLVTTWDRSVFGLFVGQDSLAVPVSRHIHLLAFGATTVLFAVVRANGAVWVPLLITATALFPVRFGYILATHATLGADAIWTSFPVASGISLVLALAYYAAGPWKNAKMAG